MRSARTVVAVVAALAVPGLLHAARPSSTPGTLLPFAGYTDMAVDAGTGRIFITGRPGSTVYVLNARGRLIRRISGLTGAKQLSLSAETHSLYVAVQGKLPHAIAVVDTRTMGIRRRYVIPDDARCPGKPVWASGKVFFVFSCPANPMHDINMVSGLASLDPETGVVLTSTGEDLPGPFSPLAASPDGTLLAARMPWPPHSTVTGGLKLYRMQPGGPQPSSEAPGPVERLVFTPDGRHLIVGGGSKLRVFDVPHFAVAGVHDVKFRANAVAVSPGGTIAGGSGSSGAKDDVLVFHPGQPNAFWTLDFGPGYKLAPDGLAWAKSKGVLYAVTQRGRDDHRSLHVLKVPGAS